MASSIIGVSSVHQTTALELSRRTSFSLSLSFSDKTRLGLLRAPNPWVLSDASLRRSFKQGISFVPSAIATPNSVLSEEAFKGFGGFPKDPLDVTDEDEDYHTEIVASGAAQEDELALAKLDLPPRLVESLKQRGITHLFPIQVYIHAF